MPKSGRLIFLPLRVHAQVPNVPDEVITLPEIVIPVSDDTGSTTTIPPSSSTGAAGVPAPSSLAAPSLFEKYGSVPIRDITASLPRAPENAPSPSQHEKSSLTIHWEGPHLDLTMDDEKMVENIKNVATFHIQKDWGAGFGGDGIMYHEVIAPSGTVFVTRDYTDVLYHSGSQFGNLSSRSILVWCAADLDANEIQLFRLTQRLIDFHAPAFPHSYWSATDCPGNQIRAYLAK